MSLIALGTAKGASACSRDAASCGVCQAFSVLTDLNDNIILFIIRNDNTLKFFSLFFHKF